MEWFIGAIIGGTVVAIGETVMNIIQAKRRYPGELKELDTWKRGLESQAAEKTTKAFGEQLCRLTQVLSHVSTTRPSVYGNTPPQGIEWSKIEYGSGYGLQGICQGVTVIFSALSGTAQVSWHTGQGAMVVSFDLTNEIPAHKITELIRFFEQKRTYDQMPALAE